MSRAYTCDAPDCGEIIEGSPVEVTYQIADDPDDDDDPCYTEAHFCSFVCLAAFATGVALDFPTESA
jgi:hypothetical protein